MDEVKLAVNTNLPAAEDKTVVIPPTEDYEAQLLKKDEEIANWKAAAMKFKQKVKQGEPEIDEDEEAKIARIVEEKLASSNLAKALADKEAIVAKALKENKELKLAQLNKTTVPASTGSHNESQPVRDTLITEEQMKYFREVKKWTDKDIERYKAKLIKGGGR